MTRLARAAIDATVQHAGLIPQNMFAVGGYVSDKSSFRWTDETWHQFPNSYHIRINTFGEHDRGNCIDVENGAGRPSDVQAFLEHKGGCPDDPMLVYCNRSNLDACIAARNAAHASSGIFGFIFLATLDGTLSVHAMTQILQVKSEAGLVYGDLSVILDQNLITQMSARIGKQ